MPHLSHWSYIETFTAEEASLLIIGVDPNNAGSDYRKRAQAVIKRMKKDYYSAHAHAGIDILSLSLPKHVEPLPPSDCSLKSVALERFIKAAPESIEKQAFKEWFDSSDAEFCYQRFSRDEIHRWLEINNLPNSYTFIISSAPNSSSDSATPTSRWPWGNHHTEALGHLEAAARRFWVNYDPADPGTAETNVTVSEWLQNERKVSKTMADAIASLLRPDKLPTGPRK